MSVQDGSDPNIVDVLALMREEQEAHDEDTHSADPEKRRGAKVRAGRVVQAQRLTTALKS